uniref:Aspartate dehydrogenase domain-containing protein n=1 Tax=Amblyomma sculptum TaxID=1581419 RepID=A0A1E1XNH6_AMBSC
MRRRVGIVGFGQLGQYLAAEVQRRPESLELAFVWSRGRVLHGLPPHLVLEDLAQAASRRPDLVVEVAHPSLVRLHGEQLLRHCDLLVGSPTAFAEPDTEGRLRAAATRHGLFVPCGALWGLHDIRALADRGQLAELTVTMTKHPSALRLADAEMRVRCDRAAAAGGAAVTLYDGPVRDLCPLAPNNVNSMAAAAMAAHTLGFDGVRGRLVADPCMADYHSLELDLVGPSEPDGRTFRVRTLRMNPADRAAVTASATYGAFLGSMLEAAKGHGPGLHFC